MAKPAWGQLAVLLVLAVEIGYLVGRPVSDLAIYRAGARAALDGTDIYQLTSMPPDLQFTYPPFAATLLIPFAVVPYWLAIAAMTVLSVLGLAIALRIVLGRLWPTWSDGRTWLATAAITAAAVWLFWPVSRTLSQGQVDLVLLGLVTADLLRPGRARGVLTGIATGIKVIPGIFILYLAVTRRWRETATAAATTVATMLVGLAVAPDASRRYWTGLLWDAGRVGREENASNQSIHGLVTRLSGGPDRAVVVWFALEALVAAGGLTLAHLAHQRGEEVLGVLLTAVTGLLVSPISWSHHWVWALPVGLYLWTRSRPAAVAWLALFVLEPEYWVPHREGREFTLHGWQHLAVNSLLLGAVLLLALAPRLLRARQPRE